MGESLPQEQSLVEDRESAATDALAWGFPRPIYQYEIDDAFWFRLGDHCVFWYEPAPDPDEMAIHIAVRPDRRFKWPARTFIRSYLEIAHSLGASRLRFVPVGDDVATPSILMRMGWEPDELGLTRVVA